MWRCAGCGEELEDSFDSCWNCGTGRDGMPAVNFQREPDDLSVPDPGPGPESRDEVRADGSTLGFDEPVVIATYNFPSLAEVERLVLEEEGILTFLADDNLVTMDWFFANAIGGAKLLVPASDALRAIEILDAYRKARRSPSGVRGETPVAFACQECGQSITFPAKSRGRVEVCPRCGKYVDVPE